VKPSPSSNTPWTYRLVGRNLARRHPGLVNTFEFSEEVGHRRKDYEEDSRQLNAAIYCTYPGCVGHAACAVYGGGVAVQDEQRPGFDTALAIGSVNRADYDLFVN
jgi:hypothetical protein